MAVHSIKNQYVGINAHLHSLWQKTGAWERFHNFHIGHLLSDLKVRLRPMGYVADMEVSLQIRYVGGDTTRCRADVLIADPRPFSEPASNAPATYMPLLELLDENLETEKPFRAIVIYELLPSFERGEPIVWIELLSPTNKGDSADADTYRHKRLEIIKSGLVYVEIDYLNETPPTFHALRHDAPYLIVILDPRPSFAKGNAQVVPFSVDSAIPTLPIPLNGDDRLTFNFGAPYQKTFEEGFFGDEVDYRQLPVNFNRYSLTDQLRIVRRMLTVLEAAKNGVDLEQAPLPLHFEEFSLEAGLKRLETFSDSYTE